MLKKIIVILAVILLIVLIAPAWYFSSMLLHPAPQGCPKDHFLYCGDPSELGLKFEDISFKAKDGVVLRGWFIPAEKSGKGIIKVHGFTADRHEGMRWARAFHRAGFNLLLFDLRGHGKSDKAINGLGMREKEDVKAAVDFMLGAKKLKHVGVFGVSLGAATAIPAMAEDKRIAAGVFEAGYADLWDLLIVMAPRDFGLPTFPILPMTSLLFRLRGGIPMSDVSPEKYIGKISPRPVFIIHCKTDPYIPYGHGERLFKAAKEPKTFYTASCAKHAQAWQSDHGFLEERLARFFRDNLK
jgi:dipeptidyl aminopeptidase/acylaminoacyl peptidase